MIAACQITRARYCARRDFLYECCVCLSTRQFNQIYGYRCQRFQCPLLFPEHTGHTCEHEQFAKGKGCVKGVNWESGGIQRFTLDRTSPLYHAISSRRTVCERLNSQAKELGIEHPKVRHSRSVANVNTLMYLVVNVRALQRAKSINAGYFPLWENFDT